MFIKELHGFWDYLFIYFEKNCKMHWKERHHTEGAKGPGEDKPTSTKA